MASERQIKEQLETKGKILEAAKKIMVEQGVDKISIRGITKAIGYSPGIVYHYFKDKDAIIDEILFASYGKILESIKLTEEDLAPDDRIKLSFKQYIEGALSWSEEYKTLMINNHPAILKVTGILADQYAKNSKGLHFLKSNIEEGIKKGIFFAGNSLRMAQSMWASMFGLVMKMIVEEAVLKNDKEELIDCQLAILVRGIRK